MKNILLTLSFVLSLVLLQAQTKKVFAHYMVCNRTYGGGTLEGYKRDIQDAQKMGVDGFALNLGGWDKNYQQNTQYLFEAAKQLNTHFVLFFSADMCCVLGTQQIVKMVAHYAKHPNYFYYQGRPFFSAWSVTDDRARTGWTNDVIAPLKDSSINVYFVPFLFTVNYAETPDMAAIVKSYETSWKYFIDGYFYFGAVGLADSEKGKNSVIGSSENCAAFLHSKSKTYMAPVSPLYWGAKQINAGRRYYEYKGGEGIAHQWQSIISIQKPEWVELVTWNDWDEGTYMSPMDDINKYWPWALRHDTGYYKTHIGYAVLNKYYIDWYKTGKQPPIQQDQLYFFYRTQTLNATADMDTLGKVSWRYGNTEDKIYITTLLRKSATMIVYSGTGKREFTLAKGIVQTEVPFETGTQKFIVRRNGKTIISAQGEDIVSRARYYNYNMYSGYAVRDK